MLTKERAIEIFEQCIAQSGCGPWSDQLRKVMTTEEYDAVKKIWCEPERPGSSTFAGTFCDIKNGYLDAVNRIPLGEREPESKRERPTLGEALADWM